MLVYLSWAGRLSRLVAEALRDWVPNVLQAVEPWLSSDDLVSGSVWRTEVFQRLGEARAGILCVTRENQSAPWLSFEAAALGWRNLVVPYLLDIDPQELPGPLAQFQSVRADQAGTFALLRALNDKTERPLPSAVLANAFEVHWPSLAARLTELITAPTAREVVEPARAVSAAAPSAESVLLEKVDEILTVVRELHVRTAAPLSGGPAHAVVPGRPRVFIGSSTEAIRIAELIQLNLDGAAKCKVWTQGMISPGRTVIESLIDHTATSDFAVIVLTPDDFLVKRGDEGSAPRDNMVFELGLFMGALGRARTVMVHAHGEKLHLPSDLAGLTGVTYERPEDDDLRAALGPACTRIKEIMGVA